MKNTQNLYEGMFILNAALSDDGRKRALDKVVSCITDRGGEIVKSHDWGRRRLAYTIEKHREGHYFILYFKVKPSAITELWQEYHLLEDLIRFVTLCADEVQEKLEFKPLALQNT